MAAMFLNRLWSKIPKLNHLHWRIIRRMMRQADRPILPNNHGTCLSASHVAMASRIAKNEQDEKESFFPARLRHGYVMYDYLQCAVTRRPQIAALQTVKPLRSPFPRSCFTLDAQALA
jgi:hypothetical protein